MAATSLADLTELIRSRRTNLLVDKERDVPVELVRELCDLAQWAPNHKRTWPCRFALFTGEGRQRLGDAFGDDLVDAGYGDPVTGDPGKVAKARTKYLRTPAILLVGSAAHPKDNLQRENLHAVAAGVQNLLLGATAAGLASYWGSPPLNDSKRALELAGFDPDVHIIGAVYLGWPASTVAVPERPPVTLTVVDS
jgi:nitroreductase